MIPRRMTGTLKGSLRSAASLGRPLTVPVLEVEEHRAPREPRAGQSGRGTASGVPLPAPGRLSARLAAQ